MCFSQWLIHGAQHLRLSMVSLCLHLESMMNGDDASALSYPHTNALLFFGSFLKSLDSPLKLGEQGLFVHVPKQMELFTVRLSVAIPSSLIRHYVFSGCPIHSTLNLPLWVPVSFEFWERTW